MGFEENTSKMLSDHDTDSSTAGASPQSYVESPYSSPSQQVPHLTNYMTVLSCGDSNFMDTGVANGPFLSITEQPNDHFRFRYKSEMVGTHGCLIGKSSSCNRTKTYPSVELRNFKERAIIRCRLSQYNNDEDHPHQLVEDEQDKDLSAEVGPQKGYEVRFQGMGIIHTAKKEVPALLYKKFSEALTTFNVKELKTQCENIAKNINLNIVRLKFTAHDISTGDELCPPVYSEPIHNMKSAATNDLKICRMSRSSGRARGGDDVFILTEKVNKKNVQVRIVEQVRGEVVWEEKGRFLQSDVHHQYAIVFRTPPYRDPETRTDARVLVQLLRPSDGRRSEPLEFTYRADPVHRHNYKKRKAADSYSSIGSSSGGSIKSFSDVPQAALIVNQVNGLETTVPFNITVPVAPTVPAVGGSDLSQALFESAVQQQGAGGGHGPLLSAPNVPPPPPPPGPPHIHLNSGDIEQLLRVNNIPDEEMRMFADNFSGDNFSDYFKPFEKILSDGGGDRSYGPMSFINDSVQLTADSGRAQGVVQTSSSKVAMKSSPDAIAAPLDLKKNEEVTSESGYNAFYTQKDGVEVKQLVRELCEMIRTQQHDKKQIVRDKLERLFELRLSNGDTFLHMTVCSDTQSSMEYIVRLVHSLKMTRLLNERNCRLQTALHLAVLSDMRHHVPFLIAKGCDPMLCDKDGNNSVHYCVKCRASCLEPLLRAVADNDVACDLNATNKDKQTALHLAAIYDSASSAELLLSHNASYSALDAGGRTALHLAAYDARLDVLRVMLKYIPTSEVDSEDARGNTALQIACGSQRTEHTLPIVRLLLDKGADPFKCTENNEPAWKLARNSPEILEAVRVHVGFTHQVMLEDDDIKSEPEEEYESAEEGAEPDSGLEAMSAYIGEVSALLDKSGGWRTLAQRLDCHSLVNWFSNTPSPTSTLLHQVKECREEMTSVTLARTLRDIGELEAAGVVLRYVDV